MTTGYEVSLPDFYRLIGDPYCQPTTARLLDEWFGYRIEGERGRARVLDAAGRHVNVVELHRTIQADPDCRAASTARP